MSADQEIAQALGVLADLVNTGQIEKGMCRIPQSLWFEAKRALAAFADTEFSTSSIRQAVSAGFARVLRTEKLGEGAMWVVVLGAPNKATAILEMVRLANEEAARLPNHPFVDQSGPDEVSIYIGLYKVATYKVEAI